MDNTFRQ